MCVFCSKTSYLVCNVDLLLLSSWLTRFSTLPWLWLLICISHMAHYSFSLPGIRNRQHVSSLEGIYSTKHRHTDGQTHRQAWISDSNHKKTFFWSEMGKLRRLSFLTLDSGLCASLSTCAQVCKQWHVCHKGWLVIKHLLSWIHKSTMNNETISGLSIFQTLPW